MKKKADEKDDAEKTEREGRPAASTAAEPAALTVAQLLQFALLDLLAAKAMTSNPLHIHHLRTLTSGGSNLGIRKC